MRVHRPTAASLRAEARLLMLAGAILLVIGFPLTLVLVSQALESALPPVLPAAVGAPPLMLGYFACRFASQRLMRAKALETARHG